MRLRAAQVVALLIAAVAVLALPAEATPGVAMPAMATASSGGQCTANMGGQWITVQCSYSTSSAGSSRGGSNKASATCAFIPLSQADAEELGLSWPPPAGTSWVLMQCPVVGLGPGPLAMLLDLATGAAPVTPQELAQQAMSELQIRPITARTAPPLGKDALVGLPEWFWVPRSDWHPLSMTVHAGPIWATATATPIQLTFEPGNGLAAVSCVGPGTPYDAATSTARGHSSCSFTYEQSSAGEPGDVYRASVAVSWRVTWTGSGGVGGVLNADLLVPYAFALSVAQAEALVISP